MTAAADNRSALSDPVALAEALIACPSVTPATGAVFDIAERALAAAGFTVTRTLDGVAPDGPVENLVAIRRASRDPAAPAPAPAPHWCFAGHLDVVPGGEGWTGEAFVPRTAHGLLYGRGAVDMKGAVAAFLAAAARVPPHAATLSCVLTGDEEGPAVHGTRAAMAHMARAGIRPDAIIVGEPTSVARLGDTMKIGRRGSVNIWVTVTGREGHVAYPHLADNPLPRLVAALDALARLTLDDGTDWFQPSALQLTDIAVGNPATNVIPPAATARLSVRFNAAHTGAAVVERVRQVIATHAPDAAVEAKISGEAFLTLPGALSRAVAAAVAVETGLTPEPSTSGGTSDARFLHALAPVVELGLVNATMHKRDEAVAIADLEALTRIYARLFQGPLGAPDGEADADPAANPAAG